MLKNILKKEYFSYVLVLCFGLFMSAMAANAASTISTNISTGGTLTVDTTSTLTGAVTMGSTLGVAGTITGVDITFSGNASTTGSGSLKSAIITSDTGAISFSNENLTTTGDITAANVYISGVASTTGSGSLKSATITSDTGAISFSNENLTTTGAINTATASTTGLVKMNSFTVGSGSTVADIRFGTCAPAFGTVTASTTVAVDCVIAGTPNLSSYRIFVTPYITNPQIIFSSASSTATGIQVAVYNTGVTGNVVTTDQTWSWMAIK
jgi:hypothetical protein